MSYSNSTSTRESSRPNRRPHIPEAVSRVVLIEAGHRCAVCGESSPLERAHIVPWCKTWNDSAENLVCLCANCHSRADKEHWGDATLREYKQNPWVMRKGRAERVEQLETVVITIQMKLNEFDTNRKHELRYAIAGFLQIPPQSVELRSIEEGSVKVFLRLEAGPASRLLRAFAMGDPELDRFFGDFPVTGMRTKTEERIARRAHQRWQVEGCPPGRDMDFWLQAEQEIERINAAATERLDSLVSSFSDFVSNINEIRKELSKSDLHGAELSDHLIQRILDTTHSALQRLAGDGLSLELFGLGDDRWVIVAPAEGTMSARVLFHEELLTSGDFAGSVEELVERGDLPKSIVELLADDGVHALAVWHVYVADVSPRREPRPALVLYALASGSRAFADRLQWYILDQAVALLGLAIEIGQRDESLRPSSSHAKDQGN